MEPTSTTTPTSLYWGTRDITLAAALMSLNFSLAGIDYQIEGINKRQVGYFNFLTNEKLIETEGKYLRGELLVEPRKFAGNVRVLKAEVVNSANNPYAPTTK